jgi:hypothetical protein
VKPTSCPNPFRLGRGGVLPAAILGSDVLDVSTIDPATVQLVGPEGAVSLRRWSLEDVAGPDEFPMPEARRDCGEHGPDGFADLTLKFKNRDVEGVLGDVAKGDTVVVQITAETTDGTTVSGVDILWIR